MSAEEIKDIIKQGGGENDNLPLSDLAKLKSITNILFNINRETGDYFYQVELQDLVDKDIDINILKENKWVLSSDEKNILLFI